MRSKLLTNWKGTLILLSCCCFGRVPNQQGPFLLIMVSILIKSTTTWLHFISVQIQIAKMKLKNFLPLLVTFPPYYFLSLKKHFVGNATMVYHHWLCLMLLNAYYIRFLIFDTSCFKSCYNMNILMHASKNACNLFVAIFHLHVA